MVGPTRKGKGTKVVVAAEGNGRPLAVMLESASRYEGHLGTAVLDLVRVKRRRGPPKRRPHTVVADRGYDSDKFRAALRRRGIRPCIPFRRHRKPRPGPRPDLGAYRERWRVEHLFARLGYKRRLLVRWERNEKVFLAFIYIACALTCLQRFSG